MLSSLAARVRSSRDGSGDGEGSRERKERRDWVVTVVSFCRWIVSIPIKRPVYSKNKQLINIAFLPFLEQSHPGDTDTLRRLGLFSYSYSFMSTRT